MVDSLAEVASKAAIAAAEAATKAAAAAADTRLVVERIDIRTKDTNETVKQIEKVVLIGNGTPSIVSRVTTLEADKSTTRWMIGVGIALGTLFTSVLALVLKFAVR